MLKYTLLVIFNVILVKANVWKHIWPIVDVLEVLESNHFKEKDNCDCGRKGPRNRILNGQNADEHEFPWQVMIEILLPRKKHFYAGGSLITMKHVLSAAHIFYIDSHL
jgi:hypothetical protein